MRHTTEDLRSELVRLMRDVENGKCSIEKARAIRGFAGSYIDACRVDISFQRYVAPNIPDGQPIRLEPTEAVSPRGRSTETLARPTPGGAGDSVKGKKEKRR